MSSKEPKQKKKKKKTAAEEEGGGKGEVKAAAGVEVPACSLKACGGKIDGSSFVRVRGIPGTRLIDPLVSWARNGSAMMHRSCWDSVSSSSPAPPAESSEKKHKLRPRSRAKIGSDEKRMLSIAGATAEFFDDDAAFREKAARAIELIRNSRKLVAFTGAGISTSAGIGDYRGPSGAWTSQKLGVEEEDGVNYSLLRPTLTHEALAWLCERNKVKAVISQNADGLHMLSGIDPDHLIELHGNVFVAQCFRCHGILRTPEYVLDDDPPTPYYLCEKCKIVHATRYRCDICHDRLFDTIVNFGDDLPSELLERAIEVSKQADVMLCLGSSLTVTPACDLLSLGSPKLVIVNRQTTAFDEESERDGVRLFGDSDKFMEMVARALIKDYDQWTASLETKRSHYDDMRARSCPYVWLREPEEMVIPVPEQIEEEDGYPKAPATPGSGKSNDHESSDDDEPHTNPPKKGKRARVPEKKRKGK